MCFDFFLLFALLQILGDTTFVKAAILLVCFCALFLAGTNYAIHKRYKKEGIVFLCFPKFGVVILRNQMHLVTDKIFFCHVFRKLLFIFINLTQPVWIIIVHSSYW